MGRRAGNSPSPPFREGPKRPGFYTRLCFPAARGPGVPAERPALETGEHPSARPGPARPAHGVLRSPPCRGAAGGLTHSQGQKKGQEAGLCSRQTGQGHVTMAASTISSYSSSRFNFAHSLFPGKPNPEFRFVCGRAEVNSEITMAQSKEKKAMI